VLGAELRPGRDLWAEALTRDGWMDPQTAVELLACFQCPDLRDTLFCNVIDPELPHAEESGNLLMGEGIAPDWNRVDRAQETARDLIDAAPEGYRAPLLTLIGWLAYLKGQSSVAAEHFKLALADAPGYRLAELMDQLVSRGTIAPVAKNQETAYKRHRWIQRGRAGNGPAPLGASAASPACAPPAADHAGAGGAASI